MDLLILGGTWFLGRTLAEQAVADGWDVTCFNRGKTGRDVPGTRSVRGDRTNQADVERLATLGRWDAVVDTSVYEPPDALMIASALSTVVDQYALISTVSAYQRWPKEPVDETSLLWPARPGARERDPDVAKLPVAAAYGTLKAGCEQAVQQIYGAQSLVLRPGVVLGPYEYVGRLPTLLRRASRGGQILAAGNPDQSIQPIDVRDLARFTLDLLRKGQSGIYNVTAPRGHATYGELLQRCLDTTGGEGELVWVASKWLEEQGVQEWTEVPLWRTPPGTWAVDSSRAETAGLACRPLLETIDDTWQWLQKEAPVYHARQAEHGLEPERESILLAAWQASC